MTALFGLLIGAIVLGYGFGAQSGGAALAGLAAMIVSFCLAGD